MQPIVIDNGSGTMKVGLAGEQSPRAVFPTVVGHPRQRGPMAGTATKGIYVGNEALAKRGILTLKFPFDHGLITNLEEMTAIWRHVFDEELRVAAKGQSVMMTEAPRIPKTDREKITQIMFETFEVSALYVATPAALALQLAGISTGIVLDVGEQVSTAVPIYEGLALHDRAREVPVGGRDLTDYLGKMLPERGYSLTSHEEVEIVRDIKEKLGYVALDVDAEMEKAAQSSALEKDYARPDGGGTITIGNERFRVAEALFNPLLIGKESDGIHTTLYDSIMQCDVEIRGALYGNIVLAGGGSMFEGIAERLKKELSKLAPPSQTINIVAPANRQHSAWCGGAKLASASSFESMWITAAEYADVGPSIVHRTCL